MSEPEYGKGKQVAQRSDLPFGSEFSPSQIVLPVLLDLLVEHEGDASNLQAAIQARYFSAAGLRRSDHETEGLVSYRINYET